MINLCDFPRLPGEEGDDRPRLLRAFAAAQAANDTLWMGAGRFLYRSPRMSSRERRLAIAVLQDAAGSMENFEQVARKWNLPVDWSADTDIYGDVPEEFR